MAATFDTLKYAEALKAVGIPDNQAKAQAAALADAFRDSAGELATKNDLLQLENRLGERLAEMRGDIKTLRWMIATVGFGILLLLVRVFWPTVAP